jgi:uncharacterized membrane protein HdeD (DUF308 family)
LGPILLLGSNQRRFVVIVIGVILLIIGGAVLYFFAENVIRFIGAVLALLGLALIVAAAWHAADAHAAVQTADLLRSSWG